jgi:hypothetical protein
MRRQGGGFGFVIMLVVLVVIFFLVMNNFKRVAPTAMEIKKHNDASKSGQDVTPEELEPKADSKSASADAWNGSPPVRPNLSAMEQRTTQHTKAVSDALSHSE